MATNVQQLIQGLAPSANNGNPNTIYNTSATPTQSLPANWTLGNLPSYKPLDWQSLAANAPSALDGFRGWGLANGNPPPVIPGTNPPPAGGSNPPPVINTGGGLPPTQTGGGGTPSTGTGGGYFNPNDGRIQHGSGKGWDLVGYPNATFLAGFSNSPNGGGLSKGNLISGLSSLGDMNINLGNFGQSLAGTALGRSLGITQDGTFNLAQALDWVLPGNLYMAQTGQWNVANIIPALFGAINPLLGFGVSRLMDYYGAKYENTPDNQLNFLQKILKNRYVKNKQNRLGGSGGSANPGQGGGGLNFGGFGSPFFGNFGNGGDTGNKVWNITIGGTGPGEIAGGPSSSGSTGNGTDTPGLQLPDFQINPNVGTVRVAPGPDPSTGGFTTAFRGGGDMPEVRNFLNDLIRKAGTATK